MVSEISSSLGEVLVDKKFFKRWVKYKNKELENVLRKFEKTRTFSTSDISKDEFVIYSDGTAEIVVTIPKIGQTIKLIIPKGKWFLKK